MKSRPRSWTIYTIVMRENKINPQPQYQRAPVWNEAKKQLLMDSVLRGYDVPKFYLRPSPDPIFEHEVVDGQQRLRAIWEFCKDGFVLGADSGDIPDLGDLSGQKHSELPTDAKDRIGLFELSLVEVDEATDLEIRDLFSRLQEGVTLNPAEKRNAMPGVMRDFVAELGDHRVFPLTDISGARFAWHDLAAIVTLMELSGGPTDAKAPDLRKMYRDNESFNDQGTVARKVEKTLNYMARVLKSGPQPTIPEMDIKWGFLDLYLLISALQETYVLGGREGDFASFYIAFEEERRRTMQDPSELLAQGKSAWDRDMYEYIEAFVRSGGTKRNIEKRHEVYKRRFLHDIPGVVAKDPTRAFSRDERLVIWRRDDETCQNCGQEIVFDEMHADHVVPHSQGGKTTLENGQTLCAACNTSKGAA